MKTYLYFFEVPGRIKIGISQNPRRRLKDISIHMDVEPKLIDAIPGGYDLEHFVHLRLSEHRLKGEWFKDCPAVRDTMNALLRDGPDAIGYKPSPQSIAGRAPLERQPDTPENRLRQIRGLSALMWPGDPVGGMAAELEIPAEDCRDYLTGARPFPRVVLMAFASAVVQFTFAPNKEREDTCASSRSSSLSSSAQAQCSGG